MWKYTSVQTVMAPFPMRRCLDWHWIITCTEMSYPRIFQTWHGLKRWPVVYTEQLLMLQYCIVRPPPRKILFSCMEMHVHILWICFVMQNNFLGLLPTSTILLVSSSWVQGSLTRKIFESLHLIILFDGPNCHGCAFWREADGQWST